MGRSGSFVLVRVVHLDVRRAALGAPLHPGPAHAAAYRCWLCPAAKCKPHKLTPAWHAPPLTPWRHALHLSLGGGAVPRGAQVGLGRPPCGGGLRIWRVHPNGGWPLLSLGCSLACACRVALGLFWECRDGPHRSTRLLASASGRNGMHRCQTSPTDRCQPPCASSAAWRATPASRPC